ncbi:MULTISPECIES: helix-turn-helix domain-containing protein [Pseudomonas]|uniref:HTH cro/C1-type domain-containing protein n=1 Tax=Pseudomonas fluorescens TaxID=294 RepID=A0A5E7AQ13_PSEFL|nr:helix-turn-helix transcriptional regulator [Pseudomonas fluorescens]VVN80609.1 hypothetical protein PS710_01087 [Pseudomonas fluorescens]
MPLRLALAAILRLTRKARGLSQEQLAAAIEARHLHNLEHAKSSVTLDTLEGIAKRLDVDAVALLAVASKYERQQSTADYLLFLSDEIQKLEQLGVLASLPNEFQDGDLRTGKAGKRPVPADKIQAVLACKGQGLTQKQTCSELGMAASTVNKIWHSDAVDAS